MNELYYYNIIRVCQELLAKYILPDSTMSDKDCLSELIGILDNEKLVITMKQNPLKETEQLIKAKIELADWCRELLIVRKDGNNNEKLSYRSLVFNDIDKKIINSLNTIKQLEGK